MTLANKCQVLFAFGVLIILATALTVVAFRMDTLVERTPFKRASDIADAWLANEVQLDGAFAAVSDRIEPLPPDANLAVALLDLEQLNAVAPNDPFVATARARFQTHPAILEDYDTAADANGRRVYRYARAIRKSDLMTMQRGDVVTAQRLRATSLADPLEMVLVIALRDPDAPLEIAVNRVYLIAAGLAAGLLAIGVVAFILMRLILSPLRLLRLHTEHVSQGNLESRIHLQTGDEFEQLGDMFNRMLDRIEKQNAALVESNKTLDLKLGELAESNVALYEANRLKGDFLANVSHELRTPLNSILGFAEVLEEGLPQPEPTGDEQADAHAQQRHAKQQRYVANIRSASRRLLDLINDLLDLAKLEAGRVELAVEPVSLSDLAEGLVGLMNPQAQSKGVALVADIEKNLPLVKTDPGKLQQVLFNLLANAIKFTPADGRVTLSIRRMPPPRPDAAARVRLAVSDTGPGVPLAEQERIFEKFVQLDGDVTREHGGTGLGLTICRELAEMLQARLDLDSQPGQGATFSLTIPLEVRQRSVSLMPEPPPQKA